MRQVLATIALSLLSRIPAAVLYCCAETWLVMAIRVNTKRLPRRKKEKPSPDPPDLESAPVIFPGPLPSASCQFR